MTAPSLERETMQHHRPRQCTKAVRHDLVDCVLPGERHRHRRGSARRLRSPAPTSASCRFRKWTSQTGGSRESWEIDIKGCCRARPRSKGSSTPSTHSEAPALHSLVRVGEAPAMQQRRQYQTRSRRRPQGRRIDRRRRITTSADGKGFTATFSPDEQQLSVQYEADQQRRRAVRSGVAFHNGTSAAVHGALDIPLGRLGRRELATDPTYPVSDARRRTRPVSTPTPTAAPTLPVSDTQADAVDHAACPSVTQADAVDRRPL